MRPEAPRINLDARAHAEDMARAAQDRIAQAIFDQCAAIAHEGGDLPYDAVLTGIAETVFALAGLDTKVLEVRLATLTRVSTIPPKSRAEASKPTRRARKAMGTRKVVDVFARDGFRCVYCGAMRELQVDHIVPLARGGSDDFDNLQTLCRSCNASKGAK